MGHERILITVKTYPVPSKTYGETVCTAGLREDGTWVRVYPVPFRKLDKAKQYVKYQWVTFDLERNLSDFRPESHKLKSLEHTSFGEKVETKKDPTWEKRRKIVLQNVYDDLASLILDSKNPDKYTSLAVFKPARILDLVVEKYSEEEMKSYAQKVRSLEEKAQQIDLFTQETDPLDLVEKIPYKFSYSLIDVKGKASKMMIEDWEINVLYRNCLKSHGNNEKIAIEKVRQRYIDDFAMTKDLYLFLGTSKSKHMIARNPFMIIGTFQPKHKVQGTLF